MKEVVPANQLNNNPINIRRILTQRYFFHLKTANYTRY